MADWLEFSSRVVGKIMNVHTLVAFVQGTDVILQGLGFFHLSVSEGSGSLLLPWGRVGLAYKCIH